MSTLSKYEQFKTLNIKPVVVDGWGGDTVYLKEMDAESMQLFLRLNRDNTDEFSLDNACAVVALHLCNAEGELECTTDKERNEVAAELRGHKFQIITQLFTESLKVSGLAKEEIEEAAGN